MYESSESSESSKQVVAAITPTEIVEREDRIVYTVRDADGKKIECLEIRNGRLRMMGRFAYQPINLEETAQLTTCLLTFLRDEQMITSVNDTRGLWRLAGDPIPW